MADVTPRKLISIAAVS